PRASAGAGGGRPNRVISSARRPAMDPPTQNQVCEPCFTGRGHPRRRGTHASWVVAARRSTLTPAHGAGDILLTEPTPSTGHCFFAPLRSPAPVTPDALRHRAARPGRHPPPALPAE